MFYGMGFRRLSTLTDIVRYGYWVKVVCPCGHVARMDPMMLLKRAVQHGRSSRVSELHHVLRRGVCGGKDFTAERCLAPAAWSLWDLRGLSSAQRLDARLKSSWIDERPSPQGISRYDIVVRDLPLW